VNSIARTLAIGLFLWISEFCAAVESEPEHVSANQFMEYASLPMGTMMFSKYLGISKGKAFVEVHQMSYISQKQWSKMLYWVEVEALDPKDLGYLQRKDR
jgi:hypothetical protein